MNFCKNHSYEKSTVQEVVECNDCNGLVISEDYGIPKKEKVKIGETKNMNECNHKNYAASWVDRGWMCHNCREIVACDVRGNQHCCPDYPHKNEKTSNKISLSCMNCGGDVCKKWCGA